MSSRILGIDPGLNITGYAVIAVNSSDVHVMNVVNSMSIVEAGVIRSNRQDDLGGRLSELYDGLTEILKSYSVDAVAVEELYSHYERPKTAITMGHARGCFFLAAAKAGVSVHSYSATQVKKLLTGNGRAPKSQIQAAVMRDFGLSEAPDPPDIADAIAIAACHCYLSNNSLLRES